MTLSFSATTVLHMYPPMLVVEVSTLWTPADDNLSAGSPVAVFVIATSEAHVPFA